MDQPPRATAAQMASRKLSSMKKPTRRTNIGDRHGVGLPQFAASAPDGGTSLFGGAIPSASSTFSFAAPPGVPTISFSDSQHKTNTLAENGLNGDDRGGKRQFGAQFGSIGTSALNNDTTASSSTSGPNIFNFGGAASQSTTTATSNSTFGTATGQAFTVNWPSTQATPLPKLGATSSQSAPTNIFAQSMPATSGVSFGQSPTTSLNQNMFGGFGNSPSTSSSFDFNPTSVTSASPNIFGHNRAPGAMDTDSSSPAASNATQQPPSLFGITSHTPTNTLPNTQGSQSTGLFSPSNNPFQSNIFSNTQPPQSPDVGSSILPNNSTTQSQQSPSLFSSTHQTTGSIFSNIQIPQTPTLFGNLNKSAEKTPSNAQTPTQIGNMMFASQTASAPTSNIFGSQASPGSGPDIFAIKRSPASSNNVFNNQSQQPHQTATSTLTDQITSSSNQRGLESPAEGLFASLRNPFGGVSTSVPAPTQASNAFSNSVTTTPNIFSALNKPVDQSAIQSKVNEATASSSFFPPSQNAAPRSLFDRMGPKLSESSLAHEHGKATDSSFKSVTSQNPGSSTSIAAQSAIQPSLFGLTKAAGDSMPGGGVSTRGPQLAQNDSATASLIEPSETLTRLKQTSLDPFFQSLNAASEIPDSAMALLLQDGLDDDQKQQFYAAHRLHTLNQAMAETFQKISVDKDILPVLNYYKQQRNSILNRCKTTLKHKPILSDHEENGSPRKKARQELPGPSTSTAPRAFNPFSSVPVASASASPSLTPAPVATPTPFIFHGQNAKNTPASFAASPVPQSTRKRGIEDDEDQENQNPVKRTRNAEETDFGSSSVDGSSQITRERSVPPISSAKRNKRAAEEELTQHTQHLSPLKQNKNVPNQGSFVPGQSNTSNILRNIVDTPSPRKTAPLPKISTPGQSTFAEPAKNPFSFLPTPATKPSTELTSTSPSKASASMTSSTNIFNSTPLSSTTAPSNMSSPKPVSPSSAPSNPFQVKMVASTNENHTTGFNPPVFGSSPVNFMAQFGQKASESEEEAMKKAKEDELDSDEDEAEWEANWKAKRRENLKKLAGTSQKKTKYVEGKGFIYDTSEASDSDTSSSTKPKVAVQEFANSISDSQNTSRASTPNGLRSSTGSVLDGHSGKIDQNQGIFGFLAKSTKDNEKETTADDNSDNDDGVDEDDENSENKDPNYEASNEIESGPDTPVEETGPGIASIKKSNLFGSGSNTFSFGSSSLFGSGASSNVSSSLSRVGVSATNTFDAAEKDSSAKPGDGKVTENNDRPETKPSGGSLMDRITKGPDGNPLRYLSNEEKENTQPMIGSFGNAKNPFASLNQKPAPTDQTWKPESPIRFTETEGVSDGKPVISFTAATPPKPQGSSFFPSLKPAQSQTPTPFSSLFGTDKAASNLFGSPGNKPSTAANVGFAFGGSTTSSLFPSATGSATTSRATSPGGTTDNESGVENDAEEKHAQVNLTAGGQGEEDEDTVFEVRAKLLKWNSEEKDASKAWPNQGVGPLRVLKHKETGVARIVMRVDPTGKLLLNKALIPSFRYEATGKTMKLLAASDTGPGLETYIVQVKEPAMATKLAAELEVNKSNK